MRKISGIAVLSGLLVLPISAQAQRISGGAERGASDANRASGPVGGIMDGVMSGVAGIRGVDETSRRDRSFDPRLR